MHIPTSRLLLAGVATIACITPAAHAQTVPAGTAAGTTISNTAQASYTVNGTPQTTASNNATFLVDRKVNLTVAPAQAGNTQASRGQQAAVTAFLVTNNTNGTQDILLDPDQNVGVGLLAGTDDFNLANLRAFVDANGNGVYDAAIDTATFIDELAADASVTVFLVGDVPDASNESLAFVSLHATVAAGGTAGSAGAALVPTSGLAPNQAGVVDIVFADGDSDGGGADIVRNGQGRAYLAYEVSANNVDLTVAKSSVVLSDGIDALNPKALPGAVVQYCLRVTNATALVPATNVVLSDVIPANTTYVPGSITIGGLGVGDACVLNGFRVNDDGSPTPLSPYGGAFNTATKTVTATIPTLVGGGSVAASFRVTIN